MGQLPHISVVGPAGRGSEIGSGSVPQQMWAKPAITLIGVHTTSIAA